jgi:type II secretory pathway pseudopilin PulG
MWIPNTAITVALISALALIGVNLIQGWVTKTAAREARGAAKEAKVAIDTVIHMVDGTQAEILKELKELTAKSAGLAGELRGRDFTREHMEARQDAVDEKKELLSPSNGLDEGSRF